MGIDERLTRLIEQHESLTKTMESLAAEFRASLYKENADRVNPNLDGAVSENF
jgi:hypothetical protein